MKQKEVFVQLVTKDGKFCGVAEKLSVHRTGDLHLAFSVMATRTINGTTEYFLQKRASDKYHSGGLWANTCCSHPKPSESLFTAATRRVYEELGIEQPLPLKQIGHVTYKAYLDNHMIEHEYDILLICDVDELNVDLNPEEVAEAKWWKEADIDSMLKSQPEVFAAWFPIVYKRIRQNADVRSSSTGAYAKNV